ncbi:MAG: PIN domain-containing protein [Spirochaetales bacterium]|nr:PIN domain-containing protein [Spirochaetales bacterium]
MKVLVDTSVWSLAFRKKNPTDVEKKIIEELKELLRELRVVLIGPIRQELLSGISNEIKFQSLKEKMRAFDDLAISSQDYENAAKVYNECRKNGIQGSQIDYLICSVARSNNISIFTTDKDFLNYSKIIEIMLHQVRKEL